MAYIYVRVRERESVFECVYGRVCVCVCVCAWEHMLGPILGCVGGCASKFQTHFFQESV